MMLLNAFLWFFFKKVFGGFMIVFKAFLGLFFKQMSVVAHFRTVMGHVFVLPGD